MRSQAIRSLRSFGPSLFTSPAHWASLLPVFAGRLRSIASIMSFGVIGMAALFHGQPPRAPDTFPRDDSIVVSEDASRDGPPGRPR